MWSIIAASVVDLPEPVVPVTRMIPRSSSASSSITGGQAELLDGLDLERDRAADDRDRAALAEGVDAEAGEAGDRVGEVDLASSRELLELRLVGEHLEEHRARCPPGASGSVSVDRLELAVQADRAGGDGTLRWRSEPSVSMTVMQGGVEVEHTSSTSAARAPGLRPRMSGPCRDSGRELGL